MEPWLEWFKRTTEAAREAFERYGMDDWVSLWKRRVWSWAAKVANADPSKWTVKATNWQPELGSRRRSRPRARWSDIIVNFLDRKTDLPGNNWIQHARNHTLWKSLELEFVSDS
eukprot:10792821-Karenia_brevis.AAC.1